MREAIKRCDANGSILAAGGRGYGFALVPAVPSRIQGASADGAGARVQPGSFPVQVRFASGTVVEVQSSSPRIYAAPFAGFDILGGRGVDADVANDPDNASRIVQVEAWQAIVFEKPNESIARGEPRRVLCPIGGFHHLGDGDDAYPTTDTTDGTAIELRPSMRDLTFYWPQSAALAGAAFEVWVRPPAALDPNGDGWGKKHGTDIPAGWYLTETIDPSVEPIATREVLLPGGWLYVRALTMPDSGDLRTLVTAGCEIG